MREPWHFYIIQGDAMKRYEEMANAYLLERFPTKPNLVESSLKVVQTTPVAVVVTADIVEDDADATEDNVFAVCSAIMSMWLAAEELGLGFVWRTRGVGLVHDERMHNFIGAGQTQKVVGTIFIGYPEEQELKDKKRTPFEEKKQHGFKGGLKKWREKACFWFIQGKERAKQLPLLASHYARLEEG